MYKVNNRRKPKCSDGFHIMQNITRAVDERFHVDETFYDINVENYKNYFQQCIDLGFIVRVREGDYLAENFNITPKGHSFHKTKKGRMGLEQSFNYGFGSTKLSYERDL